MLWLIVAATAFFVLVMLEKVRRRTSVSKFVLRVLMLSILGFSISMFYVAYSCLCYGNDTKSLGIDDSETNQYLLVETKNGYYACVDRGHYIFVIKHNDSEHMITLPSKIVSVNDTNDTNDNTVRLAVKRLGSFWFTGISHNVIGKCYLNIPDSEVFVLDPQYLYD